MTAADHLRRRRLARAPASSSPTTPSPSGSPWWASSRRSPARPGRPGGVAELAVAWVLRRPEVTAAIVGARYAGAGRRATPRWPARPLSRRRGRGDRGRAGAPPGRLARPTATASPRIRLRTSDARAKVRHGELGATASATATTRRSRAAALRPHAGRAWAGRSGGRACARWSIAARLRRGAAPADHAGRAASCRPRRSTSRRSPGSPRSVRSTVRDTDGLWRDGERGADAGADGRRRPQLGAGARPAAAAAALGGLGRGPDGPRRRRPRASPPRTCWRWRARTGASSRAGAPRS